MAKQKIRIDRRKLRQPDEFISWTTGAWSYTQTNWKMVASVGGGIVLVVMLGFAYRTYRIQQEAAAARLVSEAISSFTKDASQTESFEKILKDFPGTKSAKLARLYLGHVLYRKGEVEKAVEYYGSLARDSSVQEPIRSLAILGQGHALVALGRCQEGETVFGLLGSASVALQQEALVTIGRCFELKGDSKAALKRYKEFASRFPQSPLLSGPLRERIKSIKSQ